MASIQARLVSFLLRHTFKRRLARTTTALQARAVMNGRPLPLPSSVSVAPDSLGGVPGEWVVSTLTAPSAILLYLHGGGYFACSPKTHRPYTSFFATQGFRVFAPDYRLAPEHPFPAAIDDAVAAYRALRQANPNVPVTIGGDSAGGGLALATMLKLHGEGDPLPVGAALFSPLTDLTATGGSRDANNHRCAMFYSHATSVVVRYYLNGQDPHHPLASPLLADLAGLPPLLIHAGADETLLDDSTRLAERARAAGVPVEITIYPAVPHVWQLLHVFIPEGRQSLLAASAFLQQQAASHVSRTTPAASR